MSCSGYVKALAVYFLMVTLFSCNENKNEADEYYTLDDYNSVQKFDSHVHILTPDSAFVKQAAEENFRVLTINVDAPSVTPFADQRAVAIKQMNRSPEWVHYAATFSVTNWKDKNWEQETIAYLKDCFAKGAIAVKIWKNVGMDLKDENGKLVMIDNPRFDTILNFLTQNKIPLIGHFGEPKNCWLPIEKMTVNDYKDYYQNNPQFHMYLHPGFTTYEAQVEARDRMLEKHPDLHFVGAHLGSLEWSVDELAKRLDRFPNMAVDMAERISHFEQLSQVDYKKVRDFMIKYQDRLIYATDFIVDDSKPAAEMKKHNYDVRMSHWKFFVTEDTMHVPGSVDGAFKGLKLPRQVVDKIYFSNATKWFKV